MRKTMIAIVAAASCYAAFAAPGPGREYFGRIKDPVQIVTNGYTKAEVDALIAAATGSLRRVDGAARTLPKYLHAVDFADSYTNDAAAYYASRGNGETGGCSAVRSGGFVFRNFDFPLDERAEFVVRMSAGVGRFASVGMAQIGTLLTERMVSSGSPEFAALYKWLPGATVDGVNEHGVVAEINVVDTPVTGWHTTGNLHPLAAVRWILDNATNAQHAAEYIAANVRFPQGWTQNYHYMVADETSTYIVENGTATVADEYHEPDEPATMTNFQLSKFPWGGMGMERFGLLLGGGSITNAWYTRAYAPDTNWASEFTGYDMAAVKTAWANLGTKEARRATGRFWQTVHTSVYGIQGRTLKVAVQERDDWYVFQVPATGGGSSGGVSMGEVEAKVEEKLEPYCTIEKAEELFGSISITEEDPVFAAWLALNPLAGFATTAWVNGQGFLKSFTELDPIFSAWLASPPFYTKQQVDGKVAEAKAEAYPKASGNELAEAVRVISLHVQGEDARAVVTNYDSQTQMPALSLQYKVPDGPEAGTWRLVWNELTRWNWLTGEYLPANFYNKAEVDAKTDNVPWGFWDSQTGRYSPDNTVQMSADRVILCSGASYQRTVTAQGTYFVWTANEPYEVTGIESNGFFRIEDAEGNVTFEIVKGDKVTAAANPDGLRTETVMGVTHLHIHYPIEADAHPTLEICGDLKTHDWIAEDQGSCIANVNWTGTSGNYYAEVWYKGADQGKIFIKGTYQKGSDPYIRYSAALAVQQLKIGNVIYNVGTAQISGHTVLTLTPAN